MPTTLPTNDDLQKKFDAAARAGVSPCAWVPPEWSELPQENNKRGFPDTSSDAGNLKNNPVAEERIVNGSKMREPGSPESPPNDQVWTNAFADFTHLDETEFPEAEFETIKTKLTGEPDIVKRLGRLVGPQSPGMKRLGLIFQWVLYRTTVLMGDLNSALEKQSQANYDEARDDYINFLRDLDDHEPEKDDRKRLDVKNKKSPSGYGRALKWACLDPVIVGHKIVGARIIVKWNPHSSSAGVPIRH